jgi:hypothetical protein
MTLEEERTAGVRVGARAFNWASLINTAFGGGNAMMNSLFSQDLSTAAANYREGRTMRYAPPAMPMNLNQYFSTDGGTMGRDEIMNLIYGDADPTQPTERVLTFVVSDDIMVINANLQMTYSWRDSSSTAEVSEALTQQAEEHRRVEATYAEEMQAYNAQVATYNTEMEAYGQAMTAYNRALDAHPECRQPSPAITE